MSWSLVPGDTTPTSLPTAGGVSNQSWPVSGGTGFNPGTAAAAFAQQQSSHAPGNQVAIVPDTNGLLPGQTKFYTPPPTLDTQGQVISSVDANGAPLIQPTLSISRAALPALQAAPANAYTGSVGGRNSTPGGRAGGGGGMAGGGGAPSGGGGLSGGGPRGF
jgi:hypothetical protein